MMTDIKTGVYTEKAKPHRIRHSRVAALTTLTDCYITIPKRLVRHSDSIVRSIPVR